MVTMYGWNRCGNIEPDPTTGFIKLVPGSGDVEMAGMTEDIRKAMTDVIWCMAETDSMDKINGMIKNISLSALEENNMAIGKSINLSHFQLNDDVLYWNAGYLIGFFIVIRLIGYLVLLWNANRKK